jgi:hypothetical protein
MLSLSKHLYRQSELNESVEMLRQAQHDVLTIFGGFLYSLICGRTQKLLLVANLFLVGRRSEAGQKIQRFGVAAAQAVVGLPCLL